MPPVGIRTAAPPARLLLTGFRRFGGLAANPTEQAIRKLARDPNYRSAGLRFGILPVDRDRAPAHLLALVRRHRPRRLLLTGVAAGREVIAFERWAVNLFRPLPARGARVTPILPGGAAKLAATIDERRVLRALARADVPGAASDDAGRYACNLVLYLALAQAPVAEIGFLHVPATPESLGRAPGRVPTWPLDRVVRGLAAVALDLALA